MFGKKEGKGTKFNPDGSTKGSDGHAAPFKSSGMGGETLKTAQGLKPAKFGNGKGGPCPQASKEKMVDKQKGIGE